MNQQLPDLDAIFLSMETPETPGHIGGLALLDPSTASDGLGYEAFVEFVGSRLPLCPRFTWTLQEVPFGLDRPYWRNDREFQIDRHIHRLAVPAPGGQQELADLAGDLYARPLDRSLPLWEMYLIEGLQGGRTALLWKIHHCLMDGGSGAGLVEQLFDMGPVPTEREIPPVVESLEAGGAVGVGSMLRNAIGNGARRPAKLAGHLGKTVSAVAQWISEDGLDAFATAPATPFNGTVGPQRKVAWSSVPLADVKRMKNVLGVTVNDVILTITSGAVREYLEARGALPEESLVASVPVSVRVAGDKSMGNQIVDTGISWATDVADPVARALTIHEASTRAKAQVGNNPSMIKILGESLMPGATRLFARAAAAQDADGAFLPANAVVSNVTMTSVPLYIAGAKIAGMVPISLLAPTQGLNITVLGYNGELVFGITAEPRLLPDPAEISGAIPKALLALQEAVARDLADDGHIEAQVA